jgi:hypothetical protein
MQNPSVLPGRGCEPATAQFLCPIDHALDEMKLVGAVPLQSSDIRDKS